MTRPLVVSDGRAGGGPRGTAQTAAPTPFHAVCMLIRDFARQRWALLAVSALTILLFSVSTLIYTRPAVRSTLARFSGMATASSKQSTKDSLSIWLLERREAFLAEVKSGDILRNWVLVTGNEAGDLDSLASAVAFAYLADKYAHDKAQRHVPLIQTKRADLRLRPENERSLEDAGVPASSLLWLDDVDIDRTMRKGAKLALVDHNHAAGRFGTPVTVVAVIDHHSDEGLYDHAVPRIVTTGIGSCSSLVTTHYPEVWQNDTLGYYETPASLKTSLASLLGDSILLDTANLRRVPGKASDTDYEAFRLLLPHLPSSTSSSLKGFAIPSATEGTTPPEDRFTLLAGLKTSVSHLSTRDLLRRDYKSFEISDGNRRRAGLSSVPLSLADIGPDKWPTALGEWATEQDLDVAMILTSYQSAKKGKRRKQIAALVPRAGWNADVVEAVFEKFPVEATVLALEQWTEDLVGEVQGIPEGAQIRVWKQGDTGPTRKQIAPAVVAELERVSPRPS